MKELRRLGQKSVLPEEVDKFRGALDVNGTDDSQPAERAPSHFQGVVAPPISKGRHVSRAAMLEALEKAEEAGVRLTRPADNFAADAEVDFIPARIPLAMIVTSPYQPRLVFDPVEIAALADAIKATRQLNPIIVRPLENGKFELIAGERRVRALGMMGAEAAEAIIRNLSDDEALVAALTENNVRADLTLYETGKHLRRIYEGPGERSQVRVVALTGLPQATVSRAISVTNLDSRILGALNVFPEILTVRRFELIRRVIKAVGVDEVAGVFESLMAGDFPPERLDYAVSSLTKKNSAQVKPHRVTFDQNQYQVKAATITKGKLVFECQSEADSEFLLKAVQELMAKV